MSNVPPRALGRVGSWVYLYDACTPPSKEKLKCLARIVDQGDVRLVASLCISFGFVSGLSLTLALSSVIAPTLGS
jgi:hypothetical protein